MSIDECYQRYQGQAVSVDGVLANKGQCVQWADVVLSEVYGHPTHYGNAIDWWNSPGELLNYFDKIEYGVNSYPKKGDFVIFSQGVGSIYGHIDVCASEGNVSGYSGYDSNWDHAHYHDANGYPTLHQVQHIYANYIIGFLRPKGVINMDDKATIAALTKQRDDVTQKLIAQELQTQAVTKQRDDVTQTLIETQIDDKKAIDDRDNQIADLKAQLGRVDPNSIIVTKKGWEAAFDAIRGFFSRNK